MTSEMHVVRPRPDGADGIVSRAQRGDRTAIEALFQELDPDLRRYLGSAQPRDVDDLVGEVWLGVARSFATFEGDRAALRSWIFTIAQRRLIDHRRRRTFRQTEVMDLADIPSLAESGADREVIEQLGGQQAARIVRSLLPPGQADVVLLRVLGQFEVAEVAAILGRSDNWVRVTQHRGLRRLAERLRSPEEVTQ